MYRRTVRDGIAAPPARHDTDPIIVRRGAPDCAHSPSPPAPLTLSAFDSSSTRLLVGAFAAFLAGIVNSVAGGGTLLTFPALIGAGLSPLVANATSTVALLPASLSSMHGYREELTGARRWAVALAVPSLIGGGLGALLLLHTSNATFNHIVPWLVLGATALFLLQRQLMRWIRGVEGVAVSDEELGRRSPAPALLAAQFLVGVYGGYFGAGIGILMLATLGFMGFSNIHRMNGLKNWGAFCMNLVAAITFAFSGIVQWPVALSMAVGSIAGGYAGARAAQLLPRAVVRGVVAAVGVGSGVWLLLR
jgi:uncharacterized protein